MTSHQKIVNAIRDTANFVNPNGRFISGRVIDASTAFKGAYPLIHLYPFTILEDDEGRFDSTNILMGFWLEDKPNSTVEYMEALVNAMAVLSGSFTEKLKKSKVLSVSGIQKEPQYKMLAATLTGYAVRFNLSMSNDCIPNEDWSTYLPPNYKL